eukprot:gene20094-22064_t
MPLLRGKPFTVKQTPKNLKGEDKIFFFELTGEVFTDYDEFFERVILCNSLLWTCECTGKNGLTYKEACESEEQARQHLSAIPDQTKRAVLELVHQTRRSRLADITDEIIDYLKTRFQDGETVELKMKDEWKKCTILKSCSRNGAVRCPTSPMSPKGAAKKATFDDGSAKKTDSNGVVSLDDVDAGSRSKTLDSEYDIQIVNTDSPGGSMKVKGKQLRRLRGSLRKDLVKLFLKQTCKRTTSHSDEGYWVVEPEYVTRFALGESFVQVGPLPLETPLKVNQKRKRLSSQQNDGQLGKSPAKKRKSMDSKSPKISKEDKGARKKQGKTKNAAAKGNAKTPKKSKIKEKEQTLEQKKKMMEKMKQKELANKEKLKKKKLLQKEKEKEKIKKEREEEKQRKKLEKEKTSVLRKVEVDFLKQWNRSKDDLMLEDLKELPETSKIFSRIDGEIFGDVLMVVEFLNIFGAYYDIKESITQNITYELIENALLEHDAEGHYYDIVKFLVQTFLSISKEENEQVGNDDDESSNGTATPEEPDEAEQMREDQGKQQQQEEEEMKSGTVSSNATAAAAWPMLHQGMDLDELTIDPFTLSEILRLHILSSGVKIGGALNLWQKRGGFQFTDDPCVDFRHKEKSLLTTLHTSSLYDLTAEEKLKVLCVLCNQILTLTTTRDYIEESFYKVKELKRRLRELQNKEQRRLKVQAAERWKRRMEECTKRKEEIEKRKKEKEAREGEGKPEKPKTEEPGAEKKGGRAEPQLQASDKKDEAEPGPEQAQVSKEEPGADGFPETFAKKEEQTAEEELRIREDYERDEKALVSEILDNAVVYSEVPLGMDRIYSRYWSLKHADESSVAEQASECKEASYPLVSLHDIINARTSQEQLCKHLFMRYCNSDSDEDQRRLIAESKVLRQIIEGVSEGVDPGLYADKPMHRWATSNNVQDVVAALNRRGLREGKLKSRLEKLKERLESTIENCSFLHQAPTGLDAKPVKSRSSRGYAVVDKSLFKAMNDFLEVNLCDQLLDLEEKAWQGGLGIVKTESRDEWRENISSRMNLLLAGYNGSEVVQGETGKMEDLKLPKGALAANGVEDVNGFAENRASTVNNVDGSVHDGHAVVDSTNAAENIAGNDVRASLKTLPLKFLEQGGLKSEENSRCTTPVNVCTPMVSPKVKELAKILLQIEHGIERKYLKPPLGEDEDTKKERIREMIEAAQVDFANKNSKVEKKEAANDNEDSECVTSCLERWESSLMSATNFSQIFIHLNTLDRSIMWDKSALNAKCRLCRKKGDAVKMLLCDGCDRGFHMYCLRPSVRKIPEGDWFCIDCRPKEQRRGQRAKKRPTKLKEFVSAQVDESDNEDNFDGIEYKDESGKVEESEDSDRSDEESVDCHSDFCSVCNNGGELLCCDSCYRSYHTACAYPPIRKAPKGDWSCQVCTGADFDLPKARRVSTLERNKEKMDTLLAKELSKKVKSSNSSRSNSNQKGSRRKSQRGGNSSPGPAASRKQKQSDKSVDGPKRQARAVTRHSIGDPTSRTSLRHADGFGRYERRLCGKITEELMAADDGVPFLLPVDIKVVKDYLDFVDSPMDLSTVKQNLNKGLYDSLEKFIHDIRLIFSNCEAYNSCHSRVGRAGSRLSNYFEQRLHELELTRT